MRTGDWICTFTGIKFYLTDPHPADVDIADIAHALSMACRYGGHCREFYSVAQHSVQVFDYISDRFPHDYKAHAWALLHDAAEAYLGDMVRPLKVAMPAYKALEEKVELIVLKGLGIPEPSAEIRAMVKHADDVLLMTERRDLVNHGGTAWTPRAEPLDEMIVAWDSRTARRSFRHAFACVQSSLALEREGAAA